MAESKSVKVDGKSYTYRNGKWYSASGSKMETPPKGYDLKGNKVSSAAATSTATPSAKPKSTAAPSATPTPSPGATTVTAGPMDPAIMAALQQTLGNQSSGSNDPLVLMTAPAKGNRSTSRDGASAAGGRSVRLSEYYAQFEDMDQQQLREYGARMVAMGLLSPTQAGDIDKLRTLWQDAGDNAAAAYRDGKGKAITPTQYLNLKGSLAVSSGLSASGADAFTGKRTLTQKTVDLTNPTNARAAVNQILSNQLGRWATADEVASFTSALNAAEKANPSTSTTTSTLVDGITTGSSTTSTGGLDSAGRSQVLMDKARESKDYGAYQAATTYYNAFMSALGVG